MKRNMKIIIIAIVFLVIGGMYYYKNVYKSPKGTSVEYPMYIYESLDEINNKLPTLMMLGTSNCGVCRQMEAILRDFALKYKKKVNIVKIDIEENPEYAYEYGVMSVPTNIFFDKEGSVFDGYTGFMDEEHIKEMFGKMEIEFDE